MFTDEQLELVRQAAKKVKNQGEVAVYNRLLKTDFVDTCFDPPMQPV